MKCFLDGGTLYVSPQLSTSPYSLGGPKVTGRASALARRKSILVLVLRNVLITNNFASGCLFVHTTLGCDNFDILVLKPIGTLGSAMSLHSSLPLRPWQSSHKESRYFVWAYAAKFPGSVILFCDTSHDVANQIIRAAYGNSGLLHVCFESRYLCIAQSPEEHLSTVLSSSGQ